MFNSPVLDTVIGIVFIFLLYSLLATSVSEAIASLFALRARMLRKGIIKAMLSDTQHSTNTLNSIYQAIRNFFHALWRLITGMPYQYKEGTLGGDFYMHPIIKNYGSSRRYAIPSYLAKNNFSTVLIDVLDDYSNTYKLLIMNNKNISSTDFDALPRMSKITYLVNALTDDGLKQKAAQNNLPLIDAEIARILRLYANESYHNLDAFVVKIENWFDTSMDRVSGWYKRQGQVVLFFLGLFIAFSFNTDIIAIGSTLSKDKDARDKIAAMAIAYAKENKDTIAMQQKYKEADTLLKKDIADANKTLGIGWGDYGRKEDSLAIIDKYRSYFDYYKKEMRAEINSAHTKNSKLLNYQLTEAKKDMTALGEKKCELIELQIIKQDLMKSDSVYLNKKTFAKLYEAKKLWLKPRYVFTHIGPKKFVGFILFAFGICLGAPFWFDLLQKLVKIRAAGKKEDNAATPAGSDPKTTQPVTVTINNQNPGEAAIG